MVLSKVMPPLRTVCLALVYFNENTIPYMPKVRKKKMACNPHLMSHLGELEVKTTESYILWNDTKRMIHKA